MNPIGILRDFPEPQTERAVYGVLGIIYREITPLEGAAEVGFRARFGGL